MRALNGATLVEGMTFQPQNNRQAYLAYACGLLADDFVLPQPRTVEEALMYNLAVNGSTGGGSGETGGDGDLVITDASHLFDNGARLDSLDALLSKCGKLKNVSFMFNGCNTGLLNLGIYDLDLSGVDLSEATSAESMFATCNYLKTIKGMSRWDTSNITNMSKMFSSCSELTELDVSNFNTSKVTDMSSMFANCSKVTELDVSNFDTSNVINMSYMFNGCDALTELDVSGFDTSKVTNMGNMFANNDGLKKLDLSNFDTSKAAAMSYMFSGCVQLEEIIGFSATNKAGISNIFPSGAASKNYALKRLTFRTDVENAIRSAINVKYCSFEREGVVEMFNTLTDVSAMGLSSSYTKISLTGNPCIMGQFADGTACDLLTDEDRAIATSKGWTLVE